MFAALAGVALAGLTPTLPVPADALAAATARDPVHLRSHLAGLLRATDPGAAAADLARIDALARDVLAGRDVSALTLGAPVHAVLLSLDGLTGPAPAAAVVLPVAGPDVFRARLLTAAERATWAPGAGGVHTFDAAGGATWFAAALPGGRYVAVTPHEETARRFAAGFAPLSADQLGPAATTFAGADAVVIINLRQVRAAHGDAVRAAGQVAGLALRAGGVPWLRGFDARQRDTAASIVAAGFRVVLDGDALVVAADAGPDGARLTAAWAVTPNTPSAKLLAGETPTALADLLGLPATLPLTASRFGPGVSAALAAAAPEFAPVPGDATGRKLVADLDRLMAAAGTTLSAGPVTAVTHPDPAAVSAAHAAVLSRLGPGAAVRNLPVRARPGLADAPPAAGFALRRAAVELDLDAAAAGVADDNLRLATAESVKRLAGADPAYLFGHDARRFVRAGGPHPAAALRAFAAPRTRAGADPVVTAARGLLPRDLTAAAVVETGPTLAAAADYLRAVGGAMPAFPGWELPELTPPADPPRSAIAAGLTLTPGLVLARGGLPPAAAKLVRASVGR